MHRIVFLDRATLAPQITLRRPGFEHVPEHTFALMLALRRAAQPGAGGMRTAAPPFATVMTRFTSGTSLGATVSAH